MILMPILYVRDVDASIAFYEALGFEVDATSRTHNWVELAAGNGASSRFTPESKGA
jgi:catechol 2,3-dioxygenase-like lactoylglutathione lyase family enzyme